MARSRPETRLSGVPCSPSQVSRLLKRLRLHGIIKKVGKTYKYYLTELGRHVMVAGLTLKSMFLIPEFASAAQLRQIVAFLQSIFPVRD